MNKSNVIYRPQEGLVGASLARCVEVMCKNGTAIISPTKVGYIIMTTDQVGLEKKFELKERPKKKPGVVLLPSTDELSLFAQVDEKIIELYQKCSDNDILLGCILPWKKGAVDSFVPKDGSIDLIADNRNTSCFVINYGTPSEAIARDLWYNHKLLSFASSANPSGQGNRGEIEGVGEKILNGVDLIIEADDFVRKQQPNANADTRYEQGVMVSMVDADGNITDIPIVIRKGLSVDQVMNQLSVVYDSFDYRHGTYH